MERFGHEVWDGAHCDNCGYTETEPNGGFFDDVFLYKRTCKECGLAGCDKCLQTQLEDYVFARKCQKCVAAAAATWGDRAHD
jgi:hypothetical protein